MDNIYILNKVLIAYKKLTNFNYIKLMISKTTINTDIIILKLRKITLILKNKSKKSLNCAKLKLF